MKSGILDQSDWVVGGATKLTINCILFAIK